MLKKTNRSLILSATILILFVFQSLSSQRWSAAVPSSGGERLQFCSAEAITDLRPGQVRAPRFPNKYVKLRQPVWYDSVSHTIFIKFIVDTIIDTTQYQLQWGGSFALSAAASKSTSPAVWEGVSKKVENNKYFIDTAAISIEHRIVFDTMTYFSLWVRAVKIGIPSDTMHADTLSDSARSSVRVGTFNWQFMQISNPPETLRLVNNTIFLQNTDNLSDFKDTLKRFYLSPADTALRGFVVLPKVPFFYFKDPNYERSPLRLGIWFGSTLYQKNMSIYCYKAGKIELLKGVTKSKDTLWITIFKEDVGWDSAGKRVSLPFLVMADTSKPTITIAPFRDTIPASVACTVRLKVSDNVGNVSVTHLFAAGNDRFDSTKLTLRNKSDSAQIIIPDSVALSVVHKLFGLRQWIVVDDGVFRDTQNVSRQVRIPDFAEKITMVSNKWIPLRSRAHLDTASLEMVFKSSINQWTYNINKYRIYTWGSVGTTTKNSWIEYSEETKDTFTFIPGRLIWMKTIDDPLPIIRLGIGVTPSLRSTYTISLKPKDWTDFTNPFQFSVLVRELLMSSGRGVADSIALYHWTEEGMAYRADLLFVGAIDSVSSCRDTLISAQKHDAYTVYNYSSSRKNLLIPPLTYFISKRAASQSYGQQPMATTAWRIPLRWKICSSSPQSDRYHTLLTACRSGIGDGEAQRLAFYGPLPPSMAEVHVGIVDSATGSLNGWALYGAACADGATTRIAFANSANNAVTIHFTLDTASNKPAGFRALIIDPSHSNFTQPMSEITLSIPAKTTLYRDIAVGTTNYLEQVAHYYIPLTVQLLALSPNPFKNRFMIQYRLPHHVAAVSFALFDLHGRQLWKEKNTTDISAGMHQYYLTPSSYAAVEPAAGLYILKMEVTTPTGSILFTGQRLISCLR
ncbi:MAG: hypothetical protein JW795_09045 [Chitinivibrionales bacterium]|nr:hypothetical protein [Chitinivibrionales bacterium]